MLVEYLIKNNYVIDELDLDVPDFKVKDIPLKVAKGEILVYNIVTKRIQSVHIPTNHYWNGSTVVIDLNFNEEQKKIDAEKKLKEDIRRASIAYIAHKNGWVEDYNEVEIEEWINYLRLKSKGISTMKIIPARPRILKDF